MLVPGDCQRRSVCAPRRSARGATRGFGGLGGYSRRNQDVVVDIVFEGQGASLLTFQYLQPYFDQLIAAVQLDFALAIQPSATGLPMLSVIKTTTVHFTQFRPNPATALIQRAGGSLAPLMRDKVKARFKFKAGAQMADSEVVTESVLWARVSIGQLELAYGGTALLVRMYQTDPISG